MTMSEYYEVILMIMDTKKEMSIGLLSDEITTRYVINQLAQFNQNCNHVYFARHITLHKFKG
jgi:hypothetical protein